MRRIHQRNLARKIHDGARLYTRHDNILFNSSFYYVKLVSFWNMKYVRRRMHSGHSKLPRNVLYLWFIHSNTFLIFSNACHAAKLRLTEIVKHNVISRWNAIAMRKNKILNQFEIGILLQKWHVSDNEVIRHNLSEL